ncbi:hypothetical protein A9K66_26785 [Mesorhizobium sp. AA23]|nr:hypothetical protein A9K66_26785 [Mesorhizobium sp. AA23]
MSGREPSSAPAPDFAASDRGDKTVEAMRALGVAGKAGGCEPLRPHLARARHQQQRQRCPFGISGQDRRSDRNEPLDRQPVGDAPGK